MVWSALLHDRLFEARRLKWQGKRAHDGSCARPVAAIMGRSRSAAEWGVGKRGNPYSQRVGMWTRKLTIPVFPAQPEAFLVVVRSDDCCALASCLTPTMRTLANPSQSRLIGYLSFLSLSCLAIGANTMLSVSSVTRRECVFLSACALD